MFSISRSRLHALLKETVRNVLAEIFHDKQGNHCMDTLFMAHAQIKPTLELQRAMDRESRPLS